MGSESFPFSVKFKERIYYLPEINNGDAENFFGPALDPEDTEFPGFLDIFIGAPNLDPSPSLNATIEIALQGYTAELHRIKIRSMIPKWVWWNFLDRTSHSDGFARLQFVQPQDAAKATWNLCKIGPYDIVQETLLDCFDHR